MEDQLVLLEGQSRPASGLPEGFYKNQPRPSYSSPEVLAMVANKLLPEILRWGQMGEAEAKEVSEQLIDVLRSEHDGFKMAKILDDRFSWDADSELVDILESADFYGAAREAVMSWIRDNAVTPTFEVGKEVLVKDRRHTEMLAGIIRELTEDGMYCIRVPALGHAESGLGAQGILLPWEDVEAWNGSPASA